MGNGEWIGRARSANVLRDEFAVQDECLHVEMASNSWWQLVEMGFGVGDRPTCLSRPYSYECGCLSDENAEW